MKEHISYFLFAFTSLFTIVNPFSILPIFVGMTENISRDKVFAVARRACITAFVGMVVFSLSGKFVFNFFNISIDSLRIVGGVLFFLTGFDMLQGKVARTKTLSNTEGDSDELKVMAVTPLAIPAIYGPGAITITTVLTTDATTYTQRSILFATFFLVSLATFFLLLGSRRIIRLLGESGSKVFSRLMGLIIMMIAVEFFFKGLKPYVTQLFSH